VASKLGWQPVNELLRLEGFEEPWECAMHKGVELPSDSTLAECGITKDAMIVTVRKVLVAEGAYLPSFSQPAPTPVRLVLSHRPSGELAPCLARGRSRVHEQGQPRRPATTMVCGMAS